GSFTAREWSYARTTAVKRAVFGGHCTYISARYEPQAKLCIINLLGVRRRARRKNLRGRDGRLREILLDSRSGRTWHWALMLASFPAQRMQHRAGKRSRVREHQGSSGPFFGFARIVRAFRPART